MLSFLCKHNILCRKFFIAIAEPSCLLPGFQESVFPLRHRIVRISSQIAVQQACRRLVLPQPFVCNDFVKFKGLHNRTVLYIHPCLKCRKRLIIGILFHLAKPQPVINAGFCLVAFYKTAVNTYGIIVIA